jgi:hypothetical protein
MIIDAITQGADPGMIIGIALLAWINGFCIGSLIFRNK